jgi:hypothetical protein
MNAGRVSAMTIEIQKPELEALIMERMRRGGFQSMEDVIMQALEASPSPASVEDLTGADLIAAMQSSPYQEVEIEPSRYPMSVRNVTL